MFASNENNAVLLSIFLVDDPRHFDGTADRDALETEK
jgi:hypothetical protein